MVGYFRNKQEEGGKGIKPTNQTNKQKPCLRNNTMVVWEALARKQKAKATTNSPQKKRNQTKTKASSMCCTCGGVRMLFV